MAQEEFLGKLFRSYPWLIAALVVAVVGVYSAYQFFVPIYLPSPGHELYIAPRTPLRTIANTLEHEGVIRSASYFRLYLGLTQRARQVKPGFYRFEGALPLARVAELMAKGGHGVIVTVPEGLTLVEVQDLLTRQSLHVNLGRYHLSDFPELDLTKYFPPTATLEGFLAPDTYEFFPEDPEREIIVRFLKNFSKKLLPEFLRAPGTNFYAKLTLASMLEREVKHPDDMRLVAGILEQRLRVGKRLEVDAAIAYLKCRATPCDWGISPRELQLDSPYNTYRRAGLPPTPITNPGLNAIGAAFNPQPSPFWFYLTDRDGNTVFAKTFREHQQNIRTHLR